MVNKMAVTTDFYYNEYGGVTITDLDKCLKRAQSIIDCYILYPPSGQVQEVWYEKAICAQAEAIGLVGGVQTWLESTSSALAGTTLGNFSVQAANGGSSAGSADASAVPCAGAMMYLDKGGLLYRGASYI